VTLHPAASSRPPSALDFALLRGAADEVPFGIATTRAGVVVHANAALERIFGAHGGALDGMPIEALFEEACAEMRSRLDEGRPFDGQVSARAVDGRPLELEVHAERYHAGDGVGGFVVVRDVTVELGALSRLVEQLGGAIFRLSTDGKLLFASPAIEPLVGLAASTLLEHPEQMLDRVTPHERERLEVQFARLARGEATNASAEVAVQRPDGSTAVLQIRATGRRGLGGVVATIEGVITDSTPALAERRAAATLDSARASLEALAAATSSAVVSVPPSADGASAAMLELARDLLRECSQLVAAISAEAGALRAIVHAARASVPDDVAKDLMTTAHAIGTAVAGANLLARKLRRVGAADESATPIAELLEEVRSVVSAIAGAKITLSVDAAETASVLAPRNDLVIALVHLVLRAFRAGGSGSLRIGVYATVPPSAGRGSIPPAARPPELVIDMIADPAGADGGSLDAEHASGPVSIVPRSDESARTLAAAKAVLASIGGAVEPEEVTGRFARVVVRLPCQVAAKSRGR
jgi:PAS domain S-box-containing protein